MGVFSYEKGKCVVTKTVEYIVFYTKQAALDFEPSREEKTFLQLIGLDMLITRVALEILNVYVIQKVIINLNIATMVTKLNGRITQQCERRAESEARRAEIGDQQFLTLLSIFKRNSAYFCGFERE